LKGAERVCLTREPSSASQATGSEAKGQRLKANCQLLTQKGLREMIRALIVVFISLVLAISAWAQIGASSSTSTSQGATATQLPLSGKSGQTGGVTATELPVPGTTTSVNTLNPAIQVQGPFTGSTNSTGTFPFSGSLSLRDAIQRGLRYNLGPVGLAQAVSQAHGQSVVSRSTLLPNLNGSLSETVEQVDLQAAGLRISTPIPGGFRFPTIVGPFNFFDLRARLSQTVFDRTALNNYRSASELFRANQQSVRDARDLVVLAVGGAYLQVIAAKARVQSARAQLETADALYQQTLQQRKVGVVAQVDLDRSEVQQLTQKQRLVSLENELAKQKINLARMTGLPPREGYDISDTVPFAPAPPLAFEDALGKALAQRFDLKAAEAQVRAATHTVSAAHQEQWPSLALNGDYGVIGVNPAQSHGTFSVSGTLRVPLWPGGRIKGDVEQASAGLIQRRAELDDLKSEIEAEVRDAYLDLNAASSQVEVAQRNITLAKETLELTRQKFAAGISDNVEVVQAQEALANADLDYINSLFAHNLAKLSLARDLGNAEENLPDLLKVQ
jgi:outer membrane protein TolC